MWNERCRSGNEDDAEKGNDTSNLLFASKGLVQKDRTGPASHDRGQKGNDGCIRQWQVFEGVFKLSGVDLKQRWRYRAYSKCHILLLVSFCRTVPLILP